MKNMINIYIVKRMQNIKRKKQKKVKLSRGLGQAENLQKQFTSLKWKNISIGGYWQVKIKKW